MGCSARKSADEELTRIHIIDRDGFKETISTPNRLELYASNDFLSPQPYREVRRTYGSNAQGKTVSKITAYHANGQVAEYLELLGGRACGAYRAWHANGVIGVEAFVIEGVGDLSEQAQKSWVFDGVNRAWDEKENVLAEIYYEKGKLQGHALYYYPNGQVNRDVPYDKGEIHGEELLYSDQGELKGKTLYLRGKKHGAAFFKGAKEVPPYSEAYREGLLIEGLYCDFSGQVISKIEGGEGIKAVFKEGKLIEKRDYRGGKEEGLVRCFDQHGDLINTFEVKEGIKEGEEWVYYSLTEGSAQPKLYLEWNQGVIHGICRSWYPNGALESEREMSENKKHGVASAWYLDGSVMFIEEYEANLLKKGSYRKKGDLEVKSTIENGKGVATLYDANGRFLKKVDYDRGSPLVAR